MSEYSKANRRRHDASIFHKVAAAQGTESAPSWTAVFGLDGPRLNERELSIYLYRAAHGHTPSTQQHLSRSCALQAFVSVLGLVWSIVHVQTGGSGDQGSSPSSSLQGNSTSADRAPTDYQVIVATTSCAANLLFALCTPFIMKASSLDLDSHVVICILSGLFYACFGLLAPIASLALGARWVVHGAAGWGVGGGREGREKNSFDTHRAHARTPSSSSAILAIPYCALQQHHAFSITAESLTIGFAALVLAT